MPSAGWPGSKRNNLLLFFFAARRKSLLVLHFFVERPVGDSTPRRVMRRVVRRGRASLPLLLVRVIPIVGLLFRFLHRYTSPASPCNAPASVNFAADLKVGTTVVPAFRPAIDETQPTHL